MRPVGFEPTPTWLKARDAAVTPRPQSWSGVSVSTAAKWTSMVSCWFMILFSVVALGIELSATRLSAGFGQPALDYRFKSGTPGSNRKPPAPKAGVLPSAPVPKLVDQSERSDLNRRSPGPRPGAMTSLRHVLIHVLQVPRRGIEPPSAD